MVDSRKLSQPKSNVLASLAVAYLTMIEFRTDSQSSRIYQFPCLPTSRSRDDTKLDFSQSVELLVSSL